MTITFKPLGRQVIGKVLPEKKRSELIHTVEAYGDVVMRVEIISCGERVRDVRVGQRVLVNRMAGMDLDVGEPLVLLHETSILAYLE